MFDLSITKILVLGVIAIVIFGPEQLPRIASQAGRALRDLRRMAEGATRDLREGLGPEFAEFDVTDLHPKNFVRKHLLEGVRRQRFRGAVRLSARRRGDADGSGCPRARREAALRLRGDLRALLAEGLSTG